MATLAAGICRGCLWDSDTLDIEIKGKLTLQNAIAGRIDRNPPEYYEKRRELAAARIEKNQNDLGAYDDAAVACDRLGLHDEGIEWLAKKRKVMEVGDMDARYKTFANEGTIRFHRWIAAGHPHSERADAKLARDQIAEAIRINPEAHFGRERIQLIVMDWYLARTEEGGAEWKSDLAYYLRANSEMPLQKRQEGLIGLMMLGNAWESIDILYALSESIPHRDASVMYLVRLRIEELEDQGKSSLTGQSLVGSVRSATLDLQQRLAQDAFKEMRANADRYREVRTKFILARIAEGKHPDSDGDFWQGYEPVPAYVVPTAGLWTAIRVRMDNPNFVSNLLFPLAGAAILGVIGRYIYLARRGKGKPVPPQVTRG